jgi:CRISPR/Cas system CSM-associated protein Csm3 (group 7 of RAMP superfamily)
MTNKLFIAHIVFEAKTALKVASKNANFLQDSPIQRDWNQLPMVLGTSLTGILRKKIEEMNLEEINADDIFGSQDKGSKTIISNALLLDENGKASESLLIEKSKFLQNFIVLPIREHNAINNKGVTIDKSKYDEEVVFKGTQFKFSIEMFNENENDKNKFFNLLNLLLKNSFRIGSGSTKGFGQIEVKEITYDEFDTSSEKYMTSTSSLNELLTQTFTLEKNKDENYISYVLSLRADDFFMFGSGFGDDEADMTPVYEKIIDYSKKTISEEKVLIPASSVKGALSHRTTYYYNLLNKNFIGGEKVFEVVEPIFGAKKDKEIDGFKGNILISDIYLDKASIKDTKVFDHVSIDRFTGGAIDSALFQEKTVASKESFSLDILIHKDKVKDENAINAFEHALKDITTGMLSLGGATTKGHGIFIGTLFKDGVQI